MRFARLVILAMLALRAVRGSGLLRAALDPAPSLKTRLRASQSLVDTFKRPSGATGHRIALGGLYGLQTGILGLHGLHQLRKRGFEGRRQLPSPFGFDALADGSIEPLPSVWPSRWAAAIAAFLASAVTPRTDHGAGRGPFLAILGID